MIVIVSQDEDFAGVIAEQVGHALKVPCRALTSAEELKLIKKEDINLIVTSEAGEKHTALSLVFSKQDGPFRLRDVLANIQEMLHKPASNDAIVMGGYVFRPLSKQVKNAAGAAISLTDKEAQLLCTMLDAGPEGVDKDMLLKKIWGFDADMNTHTLETHIYRLRAKLRELGDGVSIIATDGGYTLETSA